MRTTYGLFFFSTILFLSQVAHGQKSIIINELMASNASTLQDVDGDYSDWIELYNTSNATVHLQGWSLSDDDENPLKWIFPDITIEPFSYVIIFASDKDKTNPSEELHTNFKINKSGEYIALFDNQGIAKTIIEDFPEMAADHSLIFVDSEYSLTAAPTPGEENTSLIPNTLNKPDFSIQHGFFSSDFSLELTSQYPEGKIIYSTDGSEPNPESGLEYDSPITITKTSVIRAAVFYNQQKSISKSATYIFAEDVFEQTNTPEGYPSTWGEYFESEGTAPADYGMDPEIKRDRRYRDSLELALQSLPIISLSMDKQYLFSHNPHPDSGGIYIYTGNYGNDLGKGWERPVSIEFFNQPEGLDFQEGAGIELHGGASRLAEKTPKHSLRLSFKAQYGDTKLRHPIFGKDVDDRFNSVVLRAGYGNSWLHRSASERNYALLIRDLWAKDTQMEMGHQAGHGIYVHVFLNGMYWGIYNATERLDTEFAKRNFGGEESDFDVIKDYGELVDGNLDAWRALVSLMQEDLSNDANYFRLIGLNADGTENNELESLIDLENYIDYMLINLYGANWDWDHHNWVAIRSRINPENGFKFFSWDAEHILEQIDANILDINYENRPSAFFQQLRQSPHFRRLFADQVQKHFFNGGSLTPEAGTARLNKRAKQIELAIIAESARWGDYRRDAHPSYPSGPFDLYTKEHWLNQLKYLREEYFPNRGDFFVRSLRDEELIPPYDAPNFYVNGEPATDSVHLGDEISIKPTSGDIYYTLDGTDPLTNTGQLREDALEYQSPILIENTVHIKTRAYRRENWSAVNEFYFRINNDSTQTNNQSEESNPLPDFRLHQNYPNPFNPATVINYQLPANSLVRLTVFDAAGREVATLVNGVKAAGDHSATFNASGLSSGVYLYRLETPDFVSTKKMLLIK